MLKVLYHPDLVQDVVFVEIKKKEGTEVYDEYYKLANDIYEGEDDNRGKKFRKLDITFFHRLGLHKTINEVLSEFPEFEEKINTFYVWKARTIHDAGSDLASDGIEAFLKLFPEDFDDISLLVAMLRHESMHISNMLDNDFGYKNGRLATSSLQENVVKDRYRVLWDIFIDSRLEKLRKEMPNIKEERFQEFHALFKSVVPGKEREIFEKLWSANNFTHERLRELANEPGLVAAYVGVEVNIKDAEGPLPGHPCPLCTFPTQKWAKQDVIIKEVVELVRQDLAGWESDHGICETCYDYYLNKAGLWI